MMYVIVPLLCIITYAAANTDLELLHNHLLALQLPREAPGDQGPAPDPVVDKRMGSTLGRAQELLDQFKAQLDAKHKSDDERIWELREDNANGYGERRFPNGRWANRWFWITAVINDRKQYQALAKAGNEEVLAFKKELEELRDRYKHIIPSLEEFKKQQEHRKAGHDIYFRTVDAASTLFLNLFDPDFNSVEIIDAEIPFHIRHIADLIDWERKNREGDQ